MIRRFDRWLMSLSTRRFVTFAVLVTLTISCIVAGVLCVVHVRQAAALRRAACEVERQGLAEWSARHPESPPRHSYAYDFSDDIGTPDCEEP